MSEALDPSQAPPLGTKLKGGYELVRFLGAGAMGAVYEAVTEDGRRVAIKVLLLETLAAGEEFIQRFKREANVTSTIDNDHIVGTLDAGMDPDLEVPFLVMPVLSGLDLGSLLERVRPLHPTVAVRIIRQACKALAAAHAAGVVHRDIKPGNLFLDHDQTGQVTVRVLDFGIAKWCEDQSALTMTGSMLGTPLYMSPEQSTNAKSADSRSDVYSLGATLYEMLAGVVPFEEIDSFAELHIAINMGDIPPLQNQAQWIDPGLAAVVHGAMLRDVDVRCPSVQELSDALGPYCYGSDDIDAAMLVPVPDEMRATKARRAELPTSWLRVQPSLPPPPLAEPAPDPLLGQTLAGLYTLARRIGQGGMGAVYEASTEDGERYAVKVIEPELAGKNPGARRRFVREARAVTSIEHDNVVRVVAADSDLAQQFPFIVMELLQGLSLDAWIKRYGPLNPVAAARLFIQASRGIGAAHALHLVHRDIKPGNLFLHETPSGEIVVKVCDFGIAKRVVTEDGGESTANLTRTGGVVGSPMYMSPEQAKNAKHVDHRTDIWSLGAALYEALAGVPPWAGRETVGELILAICTEPLPSLEAVAPWVPPGMAQIVHRALGRAADERLQSMDALARALEAYAGDTTVVTTQTLTPVSEEERARSTDRVSASHLTSAAATISASATAVTRPPEVAKPKSRAGLLFAGAAVMLLGGAGAYVALAGGDGAAQPGAEGTAMQATAEPSAQAAAEPTTEPTSEPTAASVEAVQVRVAIKPPTARVEVDGEEQQLKDGFLELEGKPGDEIAVAVSVGLRKLEKKVRITEDGKVDPDELELTGGTVAVGGPPRPVPQPKGPVTTPPAKPKPPEAKSKGPGSMKPKDEW